MIKCHTCQTANLDTSRFCDECGTRLIRQAEEPKADYVPPVTEQRVGNSPDINSLGASPASVQPQGDKSVELPGKAAHAVLVIERGGAPGTKFALTSDESTIGRWDADNGIFPDVDLDAFDEDAKVSRRHARIRRNNGSYFIEDLGSTNGTYVNRGRRLLPGNTQILNDGDEVIVGKTFLRFMVTR